MKRVLTQNIVAWFVADVNNQKTKNIIFFVFFDFLPKTIKSYSYLAINFSNEAT